MNMRPGITIFLTFLAAYILSLMPVPEWFEIWRPHWVVMVLIYWCIAAPERVNVGIGWLAGLVLDLLYGALLGQYAVACAVVAFLAKKMHLQVRMFPLWQQAVTVMVLLIIYQLIILWVKGAIGQPPNLLTYWFSSLLSMLIWPWLFLVLRHTRRQAAI